VLLARRRFLNKVLKIDRNYEFLDLAIDFFWKCGTIHLALEVSECQTRRFSHAGLFIILLKLYGGIQL
jgi:hypothetical protein